MRSLALLSVFVPVVACGADPGPSSPDGGVDVDAAAPDVTISDVPGGSSVVFYDADHHMLSRHDVDAALVRSDVRGYSPAGGAVTVVTPTGRYFTYLGVMPTDHMHLPVPPAPVHAALLRVKLSTYAQGYENITYRVSGAGLDGSVVQGVPASSVALTLIGTRADDAPPTGTLVVESHGSQTLFGIAPDVPLASPDVVDVSSAWRTASPASFALTGPSAVPASYRYWLVSGPAAGWSTSGVAYGPEIDFDAPDTGGVLTLQVAEGKDDETLTFTGPPSSIDLPSLDLPSLASFTLQGRQVFWAEGTSGSTPTAIHLRIDGYWDLVSRGDGGKLEVPALPSDLEPTAPLTIATGELIRTDDAYDDYAMSALAFDPASYVATPSPTRGNVRVLQALAR
jgi:hypothetical protein